MDIQEQIRKDTTVAMIAHDGFKTTALRGVSAAFLNETLAKKIPNLTNDDAIIVLKRLVKQRIDSVLQYKKGNRPDLADEEEKEIKILSVYLPATMSRADIKKVATVKQKELKITDKAKMGQLIGAVSKELKGKADGADIKAVVEGLFK